MEKMLLAEGKAQAENMSLEMFEEGVQGLGCFMSGGIHVWEWGWRGW